MYKLEILFTQKKSYEHARGASEKFYEDGPFKASKRTTESRTNTIFRIDLWFEKKYKSSSEYLLNLLIQ